MEKTELQNRYFGLTATHADGRWSVGRLQTEIEKVEADIAERKRLREEAEAAQARDARARAIRIKRRGSFDTYRRRRCGSWAFAMTVNKAARTIGSYPAVKAKFCENVAKDPLYTLEWADSFFQETAREYVAQYVKTLFESGMSEQEFFDELRRETLNRARQSNRSTSATRNLTEDYVRQAFAEAIDRY